MVETDGILFSILSPFPISPSFMVEVIFVRIWFALVGVFDKLGLDGGMGGGGSGDSEIRSPASIARSLR